jgi:hypothetical protein
MSKVLPECDVPDQPLYALYAPGRQTLALIQLFLDSSPTGSAARPGRSTPGRFSPARKQAPSRPDPLAVCVVQVVHSP